MCKQSSRKNRQDSIQWVCLLLALMTGLASCDDIIEPSLEGKQVVLLTPADSSTSTGQVQTFRWEPLSGASRYRIQIASPGFENPAVFFLDSTTTAASFTTSLSPGTYRWRVQAFNSAYASAYSTRLLRVDSTGSLTGQTIYLQRPVNQTTTNSVQQVFEWTPLTIAQRYILHLTPHPRQMGITSFDTIVTKASVPLRLAKRSQTYRWKVTALNATSLRDSPEFSLDMDVTAPGAPQLATPFSGAVFSTQPLMLTWTRATADVLQDSIYLYQADQTTLVSGFPRLGSGTSFSLAVPAVTLTQGTYYWSARSLDKAGNSSVLSPLRPFTFQ
ncbi:hypothetical protein [Hymenobacter lucidus]|uniref:Fibronectin type-III domain-containing protein n=1 Tax=Hymenobacter lucidus TaxID=2880930 RepID=A0ABS8AZC1_9BACT|nr:hypothetical protein [Hymenobacter lucidus]MCB2411159.1 hypothetical protein [Hymenobacter lucidus]